ncbi:MAG: AAA family ATPase, partial [Patescibacteria group bacterium]|nr:AAA family ATPase [Patescibacteria group bacterium]
TTNIVNPFAPVSNNSISDPVTGVINNNNVSSKNNSPVHDAINKANYTGSNNNNNNNNNVPAYWKVLTRSDLVAEYMGQTAIKTTKELQAGRGGVVFIDEAHSLVHDEKDSFGKEALKVIVPFMSEYASDTVIILAGYYEDMKESIFKADIGLQRRIQWPFHIEGYSPEELAEILKRQAKKHGEWQFDTEASTFLPEFFTKNKQNFPNYAGDCLRFLYSCKLTVSERQTYNVLLNFSSVTKIITKQDLTTAFDEYKRIQIEQITTTTVPSNENHNKYFSYYS